MPPLWVIVVLRVAIAAGTYLGGWRIIRTLGKGLVEIESPQGMAAESSSAAIILTVQLTSATAVDDARRDRLDPRQRTRQARRRGALGCGGPDGHRVADHAAVCRDRRRGHLLHRPRHRWLRRRGDRLPAAGRGLRCHLAAVAQGTDRLQERQRRMGRQPDRRLEGSDGQAPSDTGPTAGKHRRRTGPAPTTRRLARGTSHEPLRRLVQLPGLPQDPGLQHAGRCRTAGAVRPRAPAPPAVGGGQVSIDRQPGLHKRSGCCWRSPGRSTRW